MKIILTETQEALYFQGFQDAQRVELDCLDLAAQYDRDCPVVVETMDGKFLFALTPYHR